YPENQLSAITHPQSNSTPLQPFQTPIELVIWIILGPSSRILTLVQRHLHRVLVCHLVISGLILAKLLWAALDNIEFRDKFLHLQPFDEILLDERHKIMQILITLHLTNNYWIVKVFTELNTTGLRRSMEVIQLTRGKSRFVIQFSHRKPQTQSDRWKALCLLIWTLHVCALTFLPIAGYVVYVHAPSILARGSTILDIQWTPNETLAAEWRTLNIETKSYIILYVVWTTYTTILSFLMMLALGLMCDKLCRYFKQVAGEVVNMDNALCFKKHHCVVVICQQFRHMCQHRVCCVDWVHATNKFWTSFNHTLLILNIASVFINFGMLVNYSFETWHHAIALGIILTYVIVLGRLMKAITLMRDWAAVPESYLRHWTWKFRDVFKNEAFELQDITMPFFGHLTFFSRSFKLGWFIFILVGIYSTLHDVNIAVKRKAL
ncbi:hypothetical protein GZH46_00507, partial [Fragariocoptes setiger]